MERERASADLQAARAAGVPGLRSPAVIYTARADGLGATFTGANVRAHGTRSSCPTRRSGSSTRTATTASAFRGSRACSSAAGITSTAFAAPTAATVGFTMASSLVRDAEGRPVEIVGYGIDAIERC
jgi:hypothetical protein